MGLKFIEDMHDVVLADVGDYGGVAHIGILKDEHLRNAPKDAQPSAWRKLRTIDFLEQDLYLRQSHSTADLVALYNADAPSFTDFLNLQDLLGAPDQAVEARLDQFRTSNDTYSDVFGATPHETKLIVLHNKQDNDKPVGLIVVLGSEFTQTVAAQAYVGPEFNDRKQTEQIILSTLLTAYHEFDGMAVAGTLTLSAGNMALIPDQLS